MEERLEQIERDVFYIQNSKALSVEECKKIIDEVKNYNDDVRFAQVHYDNAWHGMFIPDKHTSLKEVEMPKFTVKTNLAPSNWSFFLSFFRNNAPRLKQKSPQTGVIFVVEF